MEDKGFRIAFKYFIKYVVCLKNIKQKRVAVIL